MPYVQRDKSGNITGVYNMPQPGLADTFLAEDDPAVVAYRNLTVVSPVAPIAALQAALIAKGVIVQADVTAATATLAAAAVVAAPVLKVGP